MPPLRQVPHPMTATLMLFLAGLSPSLFPLQAHVRELQGNEYVQLFMFKRIFLLVYRALK